MVGKKTKEKAAVRNKTDSESMELGERIKHVRKALGLKQNEFAARIGTTAANISEIEHLKYKPGFDLIKRIVSEFDINLYYLFFEEGEMLYSRAKKGPLTFVEEEEFSKHEKKFLEYFYNSDLIRFRLLSYLSQLGLEESDAFRKEMERIDGLKL